MKWVDDRTCEKTWTARVLTKGGRLPDLGAWKKELSDDLGRAFVLRGVEATIAGDLLERDGRVALKVSGREEVLRLAPLGEKVQWDPRRRRPERPTREERLAHERLAARRQDGTNRVRITGPLREVPGEALPTLEVREFTVSP